MMNKKTIKERLSVKTLAEIEKIARRLNYPLRGNKQEKIHSLSEYFAMPARWKAIINS